MTIQKAEPGVWDVAIVGAGPIGLLLAGELAARGIRVAVLERDESPPPVAKANGIVGHAAIELAKRGVIAGTGLRVVSPPRFQFGPLVLKLGVGPGNPLHILPIPQRRLEELLERRAIKHGAQVCRGQEVIGFTQSDTAVTIEVRSGETTRLVAAPYLVGCDGARSMVRKLVGIGFPGFTSDEIVHIGRVIIPAGQVSRVGDSVDIPSVGRVAAMRPNQLPGGGFSIAPAAALDPSAPPDLYLVSAHEPRGEAEPSDTVSIEELRESLRRVLGADLPFTDASAIRSTVGNSRQADAYRVGRVFLAGDAAHVFNAGGSALNVGLQDALELAHCLTTVLQSGASVDKLDAYEIARRPAGERALRHTRAQAALGRNDDSGRALRETVGELLAARGASRRLARLIEAA
jgi:2-polyprenyl-6-methoxyphenol hydroxylase-like FAD-dependent oxidoreductase